jgi:hypothetical protein
MARFVDSLLEFHRFNTEYQRRPRRQRLTAATTPGLGPKVTDVGSAHPGDQRFDPDQAIGAIGPLAETIREYMNKKLKCSPPGLQTQVTDNGLTQVVIADNPAVGIGLKVTVELLHPPGGDTGAGVTEVAPATGAMSGAGMVPAAGGVPAPMAPAAGGVPASPPGGGFPGGRTPVI